jgi:glycosyltransferase involved in cell wall biosynthesis
MHPKLRLAVVNHSNPAYRKRAEELGADIKILGFVSDAMLRALYTAAAVVWFPSRYEGFGLPVLEAMACGAAVVTSRASSLPEIAGAAALLASPSRSRDHVDAVSALLQDEALRRELGRKGQSRAAAFTWQTSAEKLRREFDALL